MRSPDSAPAVAAPGMRRLMRLGSWGFVFFALKGLLWLIVSTIVLRLA
jgi:hypothetical protein